MTRSNLVTILGALLVFAVGFIIWQNFLQTETDFLPGEQGEHIKNEEPRPVDKEEEADSEQSPASDVRDLIVGAWQSVQDEQSVVVFEASGEMQDIYAGGAVNERGTYQIFDSPNTFPAEEAGLALSIAEGAYYLRQTFGSENYYYAVLELDEETLILSYLLRGNILEYKKISQ